MKTILKIAGALVIAGVIGAGVLAVVPAFDGKNPIDEAKNAAVNTAIDASGIKSTAQQKLLEHSSAIAQATGMSQADVDQAIAALDIQNREATSLPDTADQTSSSNISYDGISATITTYDDPSVIGVSAFGQNLTLSVPESAQAYLPYLDYLSYLN